MSKNLQKLTKIDRIALRAGVPKFKGKPLWIRVLGKKGRVIVHRDLVLFMKRGPKWEGFAYWRKHPYRNLVSLKCPFCGLGNVHPLEGCRSCPAKVVKKWRSSEVPDEVRCM